MTKETTVQLIIGSDIAEKLAKNEALAIRDSISKLRKESLVTIPLVHITDEIEIQKAEYEIRIGKDTVLKCFSDSTNESDMINKIVKDLEYCCKIYN